MANAKNIKEPVTQPGKYQSKTAAYTIKNSESGTTFMWHSATAFNFSLPPVQIGKKGVYFDFIIRTAATSGTGHGVSPSANDQVFTPGATWTDNKDVYFATAGDAVGNGFRLTSDGVDGWILTHLNGTLSQEA